jgi:stage IV sporulation protein FB
VFAEPERTGYDLNFRLFGFPVRVHPWFWLVTLIFGAGVFDPDQPEFILAWIAIAFVSLLVHELGHALAFRAFGVGSHVVLYTFGGLAVPWDDMRSRWRRVVVSLAGPGAGFVLAAAVWASNQSMTWADNAPITTFVYFSAMYVNLAWGAVNLLPVFPLDGGRVSQEVCLHVFRARGMRVALQLSVATAAVVAAYSLACVVKLPPVMDFLKQMPWWFPVGGIWTLVLFGVLSYQSYVLLQHLNWTDSHWDN